MRVNEENGKYGFTWTPGPSLNFGRRSHSAKLITNPETQEDYILVTGGADEFNHPLDSVELLKIRSNIWQLGKKYNACIPFYLESEAVKWRCLKICQKTISQKVR